MKVMVLRAGLLSLLALVIPCSDWGSAFANAAENEVKTDYVCAKDLSAWVGKPVTTIGWPITGKTVHTKACEDYLYSDPDYPVEVYPS